MIRIVILNIIKGFSFLFEELMKSQIVAVAKNQLINCLTFVYTVQVTEQINHKEATYKPCCHARNGSLFCKRGHIGKTNKKIGNQNFMNLGYLIRDWKILKQCCEQHIIVV